MAGMKERELREYSTCAACRKPVGHTGLPLFWRVTIERFGVDLKAIRRQDGLAAMLGGNSLLAQAMGTDADMAIPVIEPLKLALCETCACDPDRPLVLLLELTQPDPAAIKEPA